MPTAGPGTTGRRRSAVFYPGVLDFPEEYGRANAARTAKGVIRIGARWGTQRSRIGSYIGKRDEVIYMLAFEDLGAREKFRAAFRKD